MAPLQLSQGALAPASACAGSFLCFACQLAALGSCWGQAASGVAADRAGGSLTTLVQQAVLLDLCWVGAASGAAGGCAGGWLLALRWRRALWGSC